MKNEMEVVLLTLKASSFAEIVGRPPKDKKELEEAARFIRGMFGEETVKWRDVGDALAEEFGEEADGRKED